MKEPTHPTIDEAYLQTWIGRSVVSEDIVTARLHHALRATLNKPEAACCFGDVAQLGIHWCLAQPTPPNDRIGTDGHPQRGDFLPPVPLPRRLWAGGKLEFGNAACIGDRVTRKSTVTSVNLKQGRTGPLIFVKIEHAYDGPRGRSILEENNLVYRGLVDLVSPDMGEPPALPEPAVSRRIDPSAVLLFRYSALTFNAHRIHYDRNYAKDVEGYKGLVVHGPLQATLLLDLAGGMQPSRPMTSFSFTARKILFDDAPFKIAGRMIDADRADMWVAGADGAVHMEATAIW